MDIKYLPANPTASYRGLHESLIDYGKNTMPEYLNLYARRIRRWDVPWVFQGDRQANHDVGSWRGRPAARHYGGLYAWCDRVPVLVIAGNDLDAAHRPPLVPRAHLICGGRLPR